MMLLRLAASFLPLLLLGVTQAAKDDSYYIAGTGNPNVNEAMYWKDAENVLQDLSQFSYLYVEFHSCAWTWMQTEEADNDVDENDYWYMGKIPPMGANVAFSLYGSKKGKQFQGCNQNTFINSFYTSHGFNDFAKAMYYAGVTGFSQFAYADDDSSSSFTSTCQGGYGVGCDYSNGFAMHEYSTNECNPQYFTQVSDKMYYLNQAMNRASCVKIYDSSSYSGYSEGTALDLLSYSHACFYQDVFSPDGECPDPYGLLAYYQTQFHKGITESKKHNPYAIYVTKQAYAADIKKGKVYTGIGSGLFALALIVFILDRNPKRKTRKKKKTKEVATEKTPPPAVNQEPYVEMGDGDGTVYSAPISEREKGSSMGSIDGDDIVSMDTDSQAARYQKALSHGTSFGTKGVDPEMESVYLDPADVYAGTSGQGSGLRLPVGLSRSPNFHLACPTDESSEVGTSLKESNTVGESAEEDGIHQSRTSDSILEEEEAHDMHSLNNALESVKALAASVGVEAEEPSPATDIQDKVTVKESAAELDVEAEAEDEGKPAPVPELQGGVTTTHAPISLDPEVEMDMRICLSRTADSSNDNETRSPETQDTSQEQAPEAGATTDDRAAAPADDCMAAEMDMRICLSRTTDTQENDGDEGARVDAGAPTASFLESEVTAGIKQSETNDDSLADNVASALDSFDSSPVNDNSVKGETAAAAAAPSQPDDDEPLL